MARLSFDEIKGLHEKAKADGNLLGQKDLKGFATTMQGYDSDNDWSEGQLPDNWVTGMSRGIDKGFAATGLPEIAGNAMGSFGSLVDSVSGNTAQKYEQLGQDIGQDIPRMAAGVGLAIGGTLAAPVSGGGSLAAYAPAAALIGLGAADAGVKAYSDSGSVGAGLVAGATAGLAPGISSIGAKAGTAALGRLAPGMINSPMARFVAAEIGQEAAFFGAGAAGTMAQGENPFTPENIFSQAAGTVAFAPLTIGRGVQEGMKARRPASLAPQDTTALMMREGIVPEGAIRDGTYNDNGKLFQFLTGESNDKIADAFKSQDLKSALSLTGLLDPDISNAVETSRRRYRGREFVDRVVENNTPEHFEANQKLFNKAVKLLQVPEVDLRDMVQRIAAVNAFEKKFRSSEPFSPAGLLQNEPTLQGFDALQQQQQRMAQGTMNMQPENNGLMLEWDPTRYPEDIRMAFDSLPNRRRLEWENEQRRVGMKEGVPDLPDLEFQTPALGTRARGRWEYDQQLAKPVPPSLSLQDPRTETTNKVRGRTDPNALENRMRAPEWSLTGPEGRITREAMLKKYDENLALDGDPEVAMRRTDNMVRAELLEKLYLSGKGYEESAMSVASLAYDRMGMEGDNKETWMRATANVVQHLAQSVDPNVAVSTIQPLGKLFASGEDPTFFDRAMGVYLPNEKIVGINTQRYEQSGDYKQYSFLKTLAHESLHAIRFKAQEQGAAGIDAPKLRAYNDAFEFSETLGVAEREKLIRNLQKTLVPDWLAKQNKDVMDGSAKYASETSDEFITEYGAMLAMTLASKDRDLVQKNSRYFKWLPEPLQRFGQALFRTMDEIQKMTMEAAKFLGIKKPAFAEFEENLKTLLTPDKELEKMKQRVMGDVNPTKVLFSDPGQSTVVFEKTGISAIDEQSAEISKSNFFERSFGVLLQTANSMKYKEAIPEAGQVLASLTSLGGRVKSMLNSMRAPYMVRVDGGILQELAKVSENHLTSEQVVRKGNFDRVAKSQPLQGKLSEMMTLSNKITSEPTGEPASFDHPDVAKIWQGMDEKDVNAMRAMYDAQLQGNRYAADLIVSKEYDKTFYDIAEVYLGAGLKHKDAEITAKAVLNHLAQGKILPPDLLAIAGTENAVRYWEKIRPNLEELKSTLDRPHFSELRTGRYQIVYDDGTGQTGREPANSIVERNAVVAKLEKAGNKILSVDDQQSKGFDEFDAVPTYVADRLVALEQARFDEAVDRLDPAAADQIRGDYTFGQGIKEELDRRKQFLAQRKFAKGREAINMVNNQAAYAEVVAASVTKALERNRIDWLMKSDNWKKDPRMKAEVEEFSHEILTGAQNPGWLRTFKKAVVGTAYGANISSAVIDSSQALTVGLWRLAETTGIVRAAKLVGEGYTKAFGIGGKDVEFDKILVRASDDGYLQSGYSLNEVIDLNDVAGYNMVRAGDRRNLVNIEEALTSHEYMAGKVFDLIKQFGGTLFNGVMIPTKASSQVNNKVTLYAGWKAALEKGLTGNDAYHEAVRFMQVSNFQGGRAASSSLKTKFGQMNGFAEAATLLTNYPMSVMSHMYGNYKSMLKSSGLSPGARQRAGQVFAGQLMTQFAMAGSLGFGLDAMFKIGEQMFGVNAEEEIRTGLNAINESGTLADVMLHGVANQVTGIDLASRFSLSGIGGFNGYTGFDAKGLFGAAGTFWANVASLPQQIADGDPGKMTVLPNGVRKLIQSVEGGPIKDANGQVLIEPSTTEQILNFVGFRPERLADVQRQRSLYRSADQLVERENRRKNIERMELMQKGDFNAVLDALKQDLSKDVQTWQAQGISPMEIKTMKEKALRTASLNLVNQTVQKTLPLDPLSEGGGRSSGRRQAIAASFGPDQAPREISMQQQQLAARLLQGLGQASVRRTPRSMRISQLTSQLIQQDPTLPEQAAQALAESMIP